MKLYEIEVMYQRFYDQIESGEIPEDAIADTLESLDGELEDKADNIACLIKEYLSEAEAIKNEEANLKERREQKQKKADSLKRYLSEAMQKVGKSKIETPKNVLSFRKSSSLVIEDENVFMAKYPELVKETVVKSVPKKDITDMIKDGKIFEYAALVEKQNLQIK